MQTEAFEEFCIRSGVVSRDVEITSHLFCFLLVDLSKSMDMFSVRLIAVRV